MILNSLDILQHLVGFPTVSRDTNLPLIDWIRNYLADLGIHSHLVGDPSGSKSNLFASIGPAEAGGLVLSGHTDVVPVEGQRWSSDPFKLNARGSRLYGRGACDMKGFIAAVLTRVPLWKEANLRRPVHLMFSYDEEVGCLGVSSMIAAAQQKLPRPAAVIVGEPTGMRLATAHKGLCAVRTRVTGIEAHSSLTHQGVSAVMLAAELVTHLEQLSRQIASRPNSGVPGFEPPHTTLSVNRIAGGTATNILAAQCEFMWDIRAVPGETAKPILDELSGYAAQRLAELLSEGKTCRISSEVIADSPPLKTEESGVAEAWVRAAVGTHERAICVPFGTEGGHFQQAGWSTVVCGPGSIEQAHKPDEFIDGSELLECEAFLDRVVHQLLV
jgi:acetylornithine deacetylase